MLGDAKCLELLDAALAACECDQVETVLHLADSSLTRFADSAIHQNVAEQDAMISVRAILGKRIGCARGNQLGVDEVRAVARRAADLAKVAAADEHFVSLPRPLPLPEVRSYADTTAASTPESRAEVVRAVGGVAQSHHGRASGSLAAETEEIAIGNSLGMRAYAPATQAALIVVVADDESSGYAEWRGTDIADLKAIDVAELAGRKCEQGRGAEAIEPGDYTVILEPLAVADMISGLAYVGMGATAFQEGRSFMCDRIGEKLVGDNITMWDDGTDPRQFAMAFDWEGLPKRKTMIIENGVALGPVYDSYTADKEGRESTGHAPQRAPNTFGPSPMHLFLGAGEATVDDMVAATDRGILVTRFHYTNIVHEKETILTGMTRDGTFLVENGSIARPVENLRFTQSVLDALNDVEMVGREGQLGEYGDTWAPALKIGKFSFTS
jgi:predicted Zn-dependent protease